MVRRQGRVKGTTTRRRVTRPLAAHMRTDFTGSPMSMMKARMETAGRKLRATGHVVGRFTHSSMREMTDAVKASREPMALLLRNIRLASRRIMRDAAAAWREVVPARTEVMKMPVARQARRPAA
ncbi:MAG TPA: hypothetical protein VJ501_07315 [Burkholderiaceae bacterium]|nr:hypothetical protein [Burkholderiaceae bacterium]